jgi:hypothetical protein
VIARATTVNKSLTAREFNEFAGRFVVRARDP